MHLPPGNGLRFQERVKVELREEIYVDYHRFFLWLELVLNLWNKEMGLFDSFCVGARLPSSRTSLPQHQQAV